MKKIQTDRALLRGSVSGFLLMSVSFVLMPIEGLNILPGLLFWGGLLIGAVLQIILEAHRRSFFAACDAKHEKMQKSHNGLLTFGSNRGAIIADNLLVCSAVATVLTFIFTKGLSVLCYVFIAITTFSFCLHCILNGRIYFYIKHCK